MKAQIFRTVHGSLPEKRGNYIILSMGIPLQIRHFDPELPRLVELWEKDNPEWLDPIGRPAENGKEGKMEDEQKYCISARRRRDNKTVDISGPMSKERAESFVPTRVDERLFKYFRVSKWPFRDHYKGGRKP